ncbi:hypothetical protein J2T08_000262 [Neorhizobium galegae]|nr:hypothetical protein [Neorhizobium galegae]MDQ0132361.1 hypothetical protein [Neorhizobium galegae]
MVVAAYPPLSCRTSPPSHLPSSPGLTRGSTLFCLSGFPNFDAWRAMAWILGSSPRMTAKAVVSGRTESNRPHALTSKDYAQ